MSELAYEFRFLPFEYQQLIHLAQDTHKIRITHLQPLSGGRSGALLYLVSISPIDSEGAEHFILKLDHPPKWADDEGGEIEKHLTALTQAPPEFAINHMARFAFPPIEFNGRIAIIYTIAGQSLQRCRPIASYVPQRQLEEIFSTISTALLANWQKGISFATSHPQELLYKWLGYRAREDEGNIHSFLREICNINPEIPGLLVDGHSLPNPLAYALKKELWDNTRHIDAATGFLHGDLHTNNVLIKYSLDSEKLENYYFIDLVHFQEHGYLFYDHLYLEFSYLLQQANRTAFSQWITLINLLAEKDLPDTSQVPAELVGSCSVVIRLRRAFEQWVATNYSAITDDLWGQFRLAAVAIGLNFCNKLSLSSQERKAALVYAAVHLKKFCTEFNVALPKEAKELPLEEQELSGDISMDWEPFLQACQGFNRERIYLLVVGPQFENAQILSSLGKVNWSLVLDFDPNTSENGLYTTVAEEIKNRRSLHLVTSEDSFALHHAQTTYWFAARGLTGRATTLVANDTWQQWSRKYFEPLRRLLMDFAASSEELPASVIFAWDESAYIGDVCMLLDQAFADRVEFIFASPNNQNLSSIANKYENSRSFSITLSQIAVGLRNLIITSTDETEDILLPSADPSLPAALQISDVNWLQEEMTLVHLGLGVRDEPERNAGRDFLQGKKISWFELSLHSDVERGKTQKLQEQIESDLDKREITRINLYHYPGSGGTTLALRIAWNLHRRSPTLILHRYSSETILRLRTVFSLTAQPILIVSENLEVSSDDLNSLYSQAYHAHIPVVFLIVTRRFASVSEMKRAFYLREQLDEVEANVFAKVYGREVPARQAELDELSKSESQARFRVPFFYGLTAFGEDFVQIETYVSTRLQSARDAERQIICYLGLAYRYAQKAIPAQLFSKITNTSSSKTVRLDRVLLPERRSLLVNEPAEGWRPSHYLIASELVEQILAGDSDDRRIWKQNLSLWAIRLIEDLSQVQVESRDKYSEFIIELFKRLFIVRESEITWSSLRDKPPFARLIEDIQNAEGKAAVLEQLVRYYPEESHFRGHFARMLSFQLDEHQRAIAEIEKALEKNGNDDVLHHIKGMILRHWIYELVRKYKASKNRVNAYGEDALQEVDMLTEQAEAEFTTARELSPENEYAYVSHIQMLIRMIEFGCYRAGKVVVSEFLADPSTRRYQEMVERAEVLLEEVKRVGGDKPSNYIEFVETDITSVYGDYNLIIQRWNGFLQHKDIYAPPIRRRLAHAYLARKRRNWDELSKPELQRIAGLMEENIAEEPENDRNIRFWFNAVRRLPALDMDLAIERLNYWYLRTRSLDATYYLYVLHALKAITEGADSAAVKAQGLIKELTQRSRYLPRSTFSYDWLGKGSGMMQLIHRSRLGEFDESSDFYEHSNLLTRVRGKITRADKPEAGTIELKAGLKAFFVPVRRGANNVNFGPQHLNMDVDFFLGFSYEGLRAWSVKPVSAASDEAKLLELIRLGKDHYKANRNEDAIAAFSKVIEKDPNYVEAWKGLRSIYNLRGDLQQALAAAVKITELQPKNFDNWYNLAGQYRKLEYTAEAIAAYKRALQIDPSNKLSTIITKKLKELGRETSD